METLCASSSSSTGDIAQNHSFSLRILGQGFECRGSGSVSSSQGLSPISHHLSLPSICHSCCPGSQPSSSWEQHLSHRVSAVCFESSVPHSLAEIMIFFLFWGKKPGALLPEFFSAIQHWILLICVSLNNLLKTLLFLLELVVLGCNQVTSQSSF